MLVLGSEQLVGRQHLYQPSSDAEVALFLSLYRLILAGEDISLQRIGLVLLQSTGDPLGATHSPPLRVELGRRHTILLLTPLMLLSWKYDPLEMQSPLCVR